MKKRWIFWWVANLFWAIIFAMGVGFLMFRDVDAAGVAQTPELAIFSSILFGLLFVIPFIIQVVWLILNFTLKKRAESIQ
ncbi:DUF3923 family protein [Gracilibacillus sp. S3-1-1]|uniref:DUF3923 family protein n=1 Tax=Gracilibacillus pellucidus TaxID=3095368 RepID=A0ACC6M8C2_9BACI|nr:DUF3923 family protein [Gracilibacillus sp. S3-1-1]MDX8047209.1 DUF3923 family protein [Gracilibacillus sp. S3-1-1]